jgi:hypothetical protein
MQQLVSAVIGGTVNDHAPELTLWLNGGWVPVHAIFDAPFHLRVVQLLYQTPHGWFALVETIPD